MDKQLQVQVLLLAAAAALVVICDAKLLTKDEEKGFLAAHNEARAAAGVGPLQWSNYLASYASNLLPNPTVAASCELTQKPASCEYELNEAVVNLLDSPEKVVESWLNEEGGESYTRVVSRGEAKLGCGKGNCGKDGSHVVCLYSRTGIVAGDRLD